jgi:hypothetical protein
MNEQNLRLSVYVRVIILFYVTHSYFKRYADDIARSNGYRC